MAPPRRLRQQIEIYLGLYQAITGPDERQKLFRKFPPGFFDLIVIDECHRGSAAEVSAWREILDYFASATQIGVTATPKETEYVSNIGYCGDPAYTYSLRQGISDGFLAPYKVVNLHIDRNTGWRPQMGQLDRDGEEVEDRIYNTKDFDRTLVLDARQLHRPRVPLSGAGHHLAPALDRRRRPDLPADRARPRGGLDDRVQANPRPRHPRARGHQEVLLHADRLPRRHQPLRRPGLRRRPGADLRARRGRPDRTPDDAPPPDGGEPPDITIGPGGGKRGKRGKIYVDGVGATIIAERVEYLDENRKLVTEFLRDFTKKALHQRFASLDEFLKRWKDAERKQAILDELAAEGLPLDVVADELGRRCRARKPLGAALSGRIYRWPDRDPGPRRHRRRPPSLKPIGSPAADVPLALLLSNVGVEVGQLLFIAGCVAIASLLGQARPA